MIDFGQNIWLVYYLGVINLVTFLCFGIDKYLAIAGLRRIPEKILWILSIVGGSAGGLLGMEIFKHKRRKIGFVLIMLLILLMQAIFVYCVLVLTRSEELVISNNSPDLDQNVVELARPNENHREDGFLDQKENEQDKDLTEADYILDDKKGATNNIIATDESFVLLDVPFLVQAPDGQWDNPRFQDGCEEAALVMARHWMEGMNENLSSHEARKEILAMSGWQEEYYGNYVDTSATDTAKLFEEYYGYSGIEVKKIIGVEEIKKELFDGKLVIVPVDGQKLGNPYYTPPGPERHMIVVVGYDDEVGQFITNDAGTSRGEKFKYDYKSFFNAIRDYLTGDHMPIIEERKVMIVVSKS